MDALQIVTVVLALGGFGACVSALVGLGKTFSIVTDGNSATWITGFDLLGMIALYIAGVFKYPLDLVTIDAKFMLLAGVLVFAGKLVIALGGSKLFYAFVRGTKLVGKSFSYDKRAVN
jgi:hypothetical protein